MPNSIQRDFHGPDWPLGFIASVAPGVPVSIMSLVDAANVNAPNSPFPPAAVNGVVTIPANVYGYTVRAHRIMFQALKPGVTHGTQVNTGSIYIVRLGIGTGTGNRDDAGATIWTLTPGLNFVLDSAPMGNGFSPYRYFIDADNAGDGAYVTLII